MSIITSLFFTFFLCLSMHACNAHRLGGQLLFASKVDAEKVTTVQMDTIQSEEAKGGGITGGTAMTEKIKESKAPHLHKKELKYNKESNSGSEIDDSSSSHVGLPIAIKIEGSRWKARSLLNFGSPIAEGDKKFRNNSNHQDRVEPDYDPPHRQSPTHNRKS